MSSIIKKYFNNKKENLITSVKELTVKKVFFFYLKWIPRILISVFVGFALVYIYATTPLTVDRVTLQKGNQTVVLQSTVHTANLEFFQRVNKDLEAFKKMGFKHFYEQVNYTSRQEREEFLEKTGITSDFTNWLIKSGLKHESLELNKSNSINIDVQMSQITEKITKKMITKKEVTDFVEIIKDNSLSEYNKSFAAITILKAGLKFHLLFSEYDIDILLKEEFKSVLIDYRNKNLVDNILATKNDLFVTYGALHKKGIVELLEKDGFVQIKTEKILAIK